MPVFGADADFLGFLLVRLGLGLLVRLLVTELAVVHDLADWGPLGGGHLDQVEVGLAGHVHGLGGGDDPQLLTRRTNQADRANANLLVHARGPIAVAVPRRPLATVEVAEYGRLTFLVRPG